MPPARMVDPLRADGHAGITVAGMGAITPLAQSQLADRAARQPAPPPNDADGKD